MKAWFQKMRRRVTFRAHRLRLWLATRLVKPLDGTVVSTVAFTQAIGQLAGIMGAVERSGMLHGQPKKLAALKAILDEAATTLLAAEQLGVPSQEIEAVQGLYLIALDRSASRRVRAEGSYRKALQALMDRFEARSKQLNLEHKARILDTARRSTGQALMGPPWGKGGVSNNPAPTRPVLVTVHDHAVPPVAQVVGA